MPSCTRRRIFTNSSLRSDLKKCLLVNLPQTPEIVNFVDGCAFKER